MSQETSSNNPANYTTENKNILNTNNNLNENESINNIIKPDVTSLGNENQSCGCMNNEGNKSMQKTFVYAIGRIRPVFRSLAIEKEYAQVLGQDKTSGLTDFETMKTVLAKKENRYLVRNTCWVLNIEGLDAYILDLLDIDDLDNVVNSFHPAAEPSDINVIIGHRGPFSNPSQCGGLNLPIAVVTNMYSFDVTNLIKTLPRPTNIEEKKFRQAAKEVFYRIIQLADNFGSTDEHRALNYLAVRYSAIYSKTAEMFLNENSLSGVEVLPSNLALSRKILEVVFTYVDRKTDVSSKYFVRVDVTEEFPFLVTKLSPYYDR